MIFLGGIKIFTRPPFFLENSDKSSLKTRDQQTTQSVESFTIKVQKVCRTENSKARWHWEENLTWSFPDESRGNTMETSRLSAGFGSSSLSIFLLWLEPEIKQAPVHLRRALYRHTHTRTHAHSHVITTPFYLNLLFFFTKIIQKRETGIFTKIHGWYST